MKIHFLKGITPFHGHKGFQYKQGVNRSHFYRLLFSFLYGLIIIITFYTIQWIVPENFLIYHEIVTMVFIIISVLILFPARQKIQSILLRSYKYFPIIGSHIDLRNMNFLSISFTVESLINQIFPDFLIWLRVSRGSLIIMDTGRKMYHLYMYEKGKLIQTRSLHRKEFEQLSRYLVKKRKQVVLTDEKLPPFVLEQMKKLEAYWIHPILYRNTLTGFLTFCEPLRSLNAENTIEIFGYKVALCIQNYILSSRVIDSSVYDLEFKLAERIQNALGNSTVPTMSHYTIQRNTIGLPMLLEPFQLEKKRLIFAILVCDHFSAAEGILLYGVLGHLYSQINLIPNISLLRLSESLKKNQDWQRTEHQIHILFFELYEDRNKINLLSESINFSFRPHQDKEEVTYLKPSKIKEVVLLSGTKYEITFCETAVTSIIYHSSPLSEKNISPKANPALFLEKS